MKVEEKFEGVFLIEGKLATKNLIKNFRVHGEKLVEINGIQYRYWNPYRSKLAAAIMKGMKSMPIKNESHVLYLGAAAGVTASFVSDIVGRKGVVYCVEFAPRAMRDLVYVCEKRGNMLPLLADARKPESYKGEVGEVDVIYEDVAQPEQDEIMMKNAEMFLKKGGYAMMAIKSQSVDVTKKPKEVYERILDRLSKKFEILETHELSPFDKDHLFVVMRKI
ncbi:MAG: fibrillarin-like rRNA/tRNA 2'-O-methyltransferase [Candidatus Micrarchaeia archaeon]